MAKINYQMTEKFNRRFEEIGLEVPGFYVVEPYYAGLNGISTYENLFSWGGDYDFHYRYETYAFPNYIQMLWNPILGYNHIDADGAEIPWVICVEPANRTPSSRKMFTMMQDIGRVKEE